MIDVVFVIVLFFMVMAGQQKVEKYLRLMLPGGIDLSSHFKMPEELAVSIEESGHVTLNDEGIDGPGSETLPQLTLCLARLKQEAASRQDVVVVTVQAAEQAKYERIIQVVNALSVAGIKHATFTFGAD
jgi:biopolymer transport protein ExbD